MQNERASAQKFRATFLWWAEPACFLTRLPLRHRFLMNSSVPAVGPPWETVLECGRACPYAYDGDCDDGGVVSLGLERAHRMVSHTGCFRRPGCGIPHVRPRSGLCGLRAAHCPGCATATSWAAGAAVQPHPSERSAAAGVVLGERLCPRAAGPPAAANPRGARRRGGGGPGGACWAGGSGGASVHRRRAHKQRSGRVAGERAASAEQQQQQQRC